MADHFVTHAREHMLARYTVNGVNASDFMDVTHSIESWDDWCKAWSARAAIHEGMGRQALAEQHYISAAEHLCRAAATYHFGKYLFVKDMAQHRVAHQKAVECHTLALPHMNPPGERVLIPYEGKQLAGVLRKPVHEAQPIGEAGELGMVGRRRLRVIEPRFGDHAVDFVVAQVGRNRHPLEPRLCGGDLERGFVDLQIQRERRTVAAGLQRVALHHRIGQHGDLVARHVHRGQTRTP